MEDMMNKYVSFVKKSLLFVLVILSTARERKIVADTFLFSFVFMR